MKQTEKMKIKSIAQSLLIAIILFTAFVIEGKEQTQEIIIKTVAQCAECKTKIEKTLMAEKGIRFAELDLKNNSIKVAYNTKKITADEIRTVISKTGYDADSIPADPEAVKRLKPCCTKEGGHME
jgi:copper chaperone CopZ